MDLLLVINSMLLGVGLAMDAFSVSIANAISENNMKKGRMCFMSGIYAIFQFAMPLIGWICVHTVATYFSAFQKFIPWIALILLLYIGGKMIIEAIQEKNDNQTGKEQESVNSADESKGTSSIEVRIATSVLLIQGVATSIDALSVGFTISDYGFMQAFLASVIIAVVTFGLCFCGVNIGKKAGEKLSGRAGIIGGIILVAIGIEIFVKGVFF